LGLETTRVSNVAEKKPILVLNVEKADIGSIDSTRLKRRGKQTNKATGIGSTYNTHLKGKGKQTTVTTLVLNIDKAGIGSADNTHGHVSKVGGN
jgi:hypothetical protein